MKRLLFVTGLLLVSLTSQSQEKTTLITRVKIIDGTGIPAYAASVRIKGNRIQEVGNLKALPGELVIDGQNKVLCPGFIDAHSHHFSSLRKFPEAAATNSQGITTIVIGQDGNSYAMDSLRKWMQQNRVAVNVASYTGHTTLREKVLGETQLLRAAGITEINAMQRELAEEIRKGSLGLSSGLEYEPAFYSSQEEVMQLAKTAAALNGRYISHIRSEDVNLSSAVEEIIQIGRETGMPVQISHIKIAKRSDWHTSAAVIARLQQARQEGINITADVYPYTFWNSTLKVLFPSRNYSSLEDATLAVTQLCDPTGSVLVNYAPVPGYKGKTLSAIAAERKETPAQTLIRLIAMADSFRRARPDYEGSVETIMGKSMTEDDIRNFIAWPHSVICSDGGNGGHPRGYGAFTRVLSQYVRQEPLLPLATAIHKMTGLTAEFLGIKERGVIAPGYIADLVLLQPEKIRDRADIQNSKAFSEGIDRVWVSGQITWQQQQPTGNRPGVLVTAATPDKK
ncbi:MAG: D-aminoacylase [Chitinophagaceae bacterium]|nr:D-aminoacylase [Chitinophagaceae bacterium]MCA6468989.1 D-aminoacylase [Chitinophagaceae bacterium]